MRKSVTNPLTWDVHRRLISIFGIVRGAPDSHGDAPGCKPEGFEDLVACKRHSFARATNDNGSIDLHANFFVPKNSAYLRCALATKRRGRHMTCSNGAELFWRVASGVRVTKASTHEGTSKSTFKESCKRLGWQ